MTRLIVSLDKLQVSDIILLLEEIKNIAVPSENIIFKFNDIISLIGFNGINEFPLGDHKIMIDLKWNDIPNTIKNYIEQLSISGLAQKVEYFTVHASGGKAMMKAAIESRNEQKLTTKILAITALTSLENSDIQDIYGENTKETVLKLARLAYESGVDGLVCSPLEASILREIYDDSFFLVTPGVRFEGSQNIGDQKRIASPKTTIENGATDIVMGRDILTGDRTKNIERFFREIGEVTQIKKKNNFEVESLLASGDWLEIIKYIGALYFRPENGKYCRYTSGLISNSYANIGVIERDYRIVEKAVTDIKNKLEAKHIFGDVVMGAQMGSIRLSLALGKKLGITESIYTEKGGEGDKDMILKRHDIDLEGKRVILSEDIITKGSTLKKMIELVKEKGGEVVAVTCLGNRYGTDDFAGIPLISCFVPPPFELYFDEKTPLEVRGNALPFPGGNISEKPKNDWIHLVNSMKPTLGKGS